MHLGRKYARFRPPHSCIFYKYAYDRVLAYRRHRICRQRKGYGYDSRNAQFACLVLDESRRP